MLCFPISIFPSFCFICSNTISFSHQTRNLDFAMNNILVLLSLYLSQLFGHDRASFPLTGHFFQPLVLVLVLLAVTVSINAEEKWSWSKPNGGGGGAAADRNSPDRVRSDVIAFQDTKRFGSDAANDRKFNQQQDVRYER